MGMWECAWRCGKSKLGSECQLHSKNRSLIIYGSDLGSICYTSIHKLRNNKCGRELQECISAHYLLCSNQLFDFFLVEFAQWGKEFAQSDIIPTLLTIFLLTLLFLLRNHIKYRRKEWFEGS